MARKKRKDFFEVIDSRSKKAKKRKTLEYPSSLLSDLKKAKERAERVNKKPEKIDVSDNSRVNPSIDTPNDPPKAILNTPVDPPIDTRDTPINTPVTPPDTPVDTPVTPHDTATNPSVNPVKDTPINTPNNPPKTLPIDTLKNTLKEVPENELIKKFGFCLSKNQYMVLMHLLKKPERITKRKWICQDTGIKINSIKSAIRGLVEKRFITSHRYACSGTFKGLTYILDEKKCKEYLDLCNRVIVAPPDDPPNDTPIDPLANPLSGLTSCSSPKRLSNRYPDKPSDRPPLYSSSSLLYINTTTGEIESILSTHPELGYWRQKGLTAKQVRQWTKAAGCSLENMIQYLCFCRFEMVDLDLEKSKPVDSVFNWFFRIIEKTGAYPKPKGYKSFTEKQLETERQLVEQKEQEAREARELYRRKMNAELDKKFWEMMNDPESDLYKRCFDSLNDFQKRRTCGKGFEMSMRSAFDKLMNGELDGADKDSK